MEATMVDGLIDLRRQALALGSKAGADALEAALYLAGVRLKDGADGRTDWIRIDTQGAPYSFLTNCAIVMKPSETSPLFEPLPMGAFKVRLDDYAVIPRTMYEDMSKKLTMMGQLGSHI